MKVKKLGLIIIALCYVFVGCLACSSAENNNYLPGTSANSKFATVPQISVVAELGEDILGYPELQAEITNNSTKDIAAINFYVLFYDVYGDLITNTLDSNRLYTDDTILPGKTDSAKWGFYSKKIKTVELYIYSVYYVDGTEWGDKDATKSVILNNAYRVEVL